MKVQGTCKQNTYCTALIKTTTEETTGKIQGKVCSTLWSRNRSRAFPLSLPDNVRLSVAGQLFQGVSFQHIFVNVRDSNNVGTDLKQV